MSRQKVWFTADTHFGHENIIQYCNRPFNSVEEMDSILIENINLLVKSNDILYHLGDFCFCRNKKNRIEACQNYLARINCKNIILIAGNHEPHNKNGKTVSEFVNLFMEYHTLVRIKIQVGDTIQEIVLCHYAMRVWNKSHYGSWHLYGHSHGTLPDLPHSLSMDVGVDCHNYMPISPELIATKMAVKTFVPIHHTIYHFG